MNQQLFNPFAADIEVLMVYDKPILFSCHDAQGAPHIALLIEDDTEWEVWLVVQLSAERFTQVLSGEVELRAAFAEAESGMVQRLVVGTEGDILANRLIPTAELEDCDLPLAGDRLGVQ